MKLNEDSRVKIPTILHLMRLGYEYLSLKDPKVTKLTDRSGTRLIDFEDFNNNTFNVVTELTYKKDDEEFRPDIILLINGLPLAFIEVKKPNNKDGIQAEHKRIQTRFQKRNRTPMTVSVGVPTCQLDI